MSKESECPKCRKGWVRTRYSPTSSNRLRREGECLTKTCMGCGYSWEEETEDAKPLTPATGE